MSGYREKTRKAHPIHALLGLLVETPSPKHSSILAGGQKSPAVACPLWVQVHSHRQAPAACSSVGAEEGGDRRAEEAVEAEQRTPASRCSNRATDWGCGDRCAEGEAAPFWELSWS